MKEHPCAPLTQGELLSFAGTIAKMESEIGQIQEALGRIIEAAEHLEKKVDSLMKLKNNIHGGVAFFLFMAGASAGLLMPAISNLIP